MAGGREAAHSGADFGEDGRRRKVANTGIVHSRPIKERKGAWPATTSASIRSIAASIS
jgi:hypothetical protein